MSKSLYICQESSYPPNMEEDIAGHFKWILGRHMRQLTANQAVCSRVCQAYLTENLKSRVPDALSKEATGDKWIQ